MMGAAQQQSGGAIARTLAKWAAVAGSAIVLTVYFVRAFDARDQRDLTTEHRMRLASEFEASREADTDWPAYLEIEESLAAELAGAIGDTARPDSLLDRYSAGSLTDPRTFSRDWNRSYEITVAAPRGIALLLHGLTDSPYSMRATANALAGAGYGVVVPRMPGHGFAVGSLQHVRAEDWAAATRIAARHAASRAGAGLPLVLVGYSNGALLALDYASRCDELAGLRCPDALVLLSPAIDVSPFAAVAGWHAAVSWLPMFEKFEWFSILPEIDPFKFTSFPKRAVRQFHEIAVRTRERLAEPSEAATLPPVLTFQSVVDNTVTAEAIVTDLYAKLPENGSELVVFDINRDSTILHLLEREPDSVLRYFSDGAPWQFAVTVVTNRNAETLEVDAARLAAGERSFVAWPTGLAWPAEIYSLSHIAVPFRADDPVYGDGALRAADEPGGFVLGALAPRGEQGVLQLGPEYFLRTRYNPFFGYQERRLLEWLAERLKSQ